MLRAPDPAFGSVLGARESRLIRCNYGLRAIAQSKLCKDAAHVSLDGLLATTSASAISVFDMPRAMSAAGPWIAVIPMASARRQLPLTAALAWARLGARVHDVVPHRADRSDLEALAGSDVIVLLGGYPDRLIASLGASVIWDRVLDLPLGERPAPDPASPGRVTAGPALHHPAPEFA